jgi:hypothetical protein
MSTKVPPFVLTVLATVNASFSEKLDAQGLGCCLLDLNKAKDKPGHVLAFFSEVGPDLQIKFADHVIGMPEEQLKASAKAFSNYSGYPLPLAA